MGTDLLPENPHDRPTSNGAVSAVGVFDGASKLRHRPQRAFGQIDISTPLKLALFASQVRLHMSRQIRRIENKAGRGHLDCGGGVETNRKDEEISGQEKVFAALDEGQEALGRRQRDHARTGWCATR